MVGLVVTPTMVPFATIHSSSPDCSKGRLRSSSQTEVPEFANRSNEFIDLFPFRLRWAGQVPLAAALLKVIAN